MKLTARFKDYLQTMAGKANEPLCLTTVMAPLGMVIASGTKNSNDLLCGHLLDYLAAEFTNDSEIDCFDIATAALELGHIPADAFLDQAPWLIVEQLQLAQNQNS